MVPSIRLSALALLGSASATNDLEVSLMQGLNPGVNHRDSPKSVSNLLETAGNMLRNGATPDVVDFTRTILEEISGVVFPAILDAHNIDEGRVSTAFGQFAALIATMEESTSEIERLREEDVSRTDSHKLCREDENRLCEIKRQCDYDLYDLWVGFMYEESALRTIEDEIKGHYCSGNGTLATFRDQSVLHFQTFIPHQWHVTGEYYHKFEVYLREDRYDSKVVQCEEHFRDLDGKTAECDALQTNFEDTACQLALAIKQARTDFTCAWSRTLIEYNAIVREIQILEADRKLECHSLSVVECLLERAQERNGRPCDETTDEAEIEFTHCEHNSTSVDCSWLDIVYPDPPPYPPPPTPPTYPCSPAFVNEEYNFLWYQEVPQPLFHNTNSHCNQRPDCQACPGMDDPDETCDIPASSTLWTQHMEDRAKCNNNIDLHHVADQAACQALAVTAGHYYYSFRHNADSQGRHKCMSSAHCQNYLTSTGNEWNMYVSPGLPVR